VGSSGRHKFMQIGWAHGCYEYCYRPSVMGGPMGHMNTAVAYDGWAHRSYQYCSGLNGGWAHGTYQYCSGLYDGWAHWCASYCMMDRPIGVA
jgi:hypothetical protein